MKYLRLVTVCGPRIAWSYTWLNHYYRHPEKYSRLKRYKKVRSFICFICKKLRIDFIVDGMENIPLEHGMLFTPNHQSFLDALSLIVLLDEPTSFIAKKSSKKMPCVGKIIQTLEGLFIDRNNLRQEMNIMKKVRNSLKNDNIQWIIFPEGTRSKDENHTIAQFHPGSYKMAMMEGKTIVPVAIYGTFRPLSTKLNYKKYPVHVSFLKPIKKEDYEQYSTTELAPLIQKMIETRVEELKVKDAEYLKTNNIIKA